MITALLRTRELQIAPGDSAELQVDLVNFNRDPVVTRIRVLGAPPGIVNLPDQPAPIVPGDTVRVGISFTVPNTFSSGHHALSLEVVDDDGPRVIPFSLTVLPLDDVALSVTPASVRGRFRGRFNVVLHNRGSAAVDLDLRSESDHVKVAFKPPTVRVRPGERTATKGRVRSRPVLFATSTRKPFTVVAQGRSRPLRTGAAFSQRPLIGAVLRRGAAVAGLMGMAALAIWFGLGLFTSSGDLVDDNNSEFAQGDDGASNADLDGTVGGSDEQGDLATAGGTIELADGSTPDGVEVELRSVSFNDTARDTKVFFNDGESPQTKTFARNLYRVRLLQAEERNPTVFSGEDGSWKHHSLVVGGYYELIFRKSGYATQSFLVTPTSGDEGVKLNVVLEAGDGRLGGTLTGIGGKLGGATVTVTDGEVTYVVTTSTDPADRGAWQVEGLGTPGRYTITFEHPTHGTRVQAVNLGASGSDDQIDATLRASEGDIFGVTSVDIGDDENQLRGGITIRLFNDDLSYSTTSLSEPDEDGFGVGSFRIPDVPTGTVFTLQASGVGLKTWSREVNTATTANVGEIVLAPTSGTLRGTVVDVDDESALEGVRVSLVGDDVELSVFTSAQGVFDFEAVPIGAYDLTFERYDADTTNSRVEIPYFGDPLVIPMTVNDGTGIVISAAVRGNVSDIDGVPIAGALVTIVGYPAPPGTPSYPDTGWIVAETDSDGNYEFTAIEPGGYMIRASHPNHLSAEQPAVLANDSVVERDIQLIMLGAFSGRVTNTSSAGINQAVVSATQRSGTPQVVVAPVVTSEQLGDGDGIFNISATLPLSSTWELTARANGYAPRQVEALINSFGDSVYNGEVVSEIDIALELRPELVFEIVEPKLDSECPPQSVPCFQPLQGATVELTQVPEGFNEPGALNLGRSAVTGADGRVVFSEAVGGEYVSDGAKPIAGTYTYTVTTDNGTFLDISESTVTVAATGNAGVPAVTTVRVAMVSASLPTPPQYLVGGELRYPFGEDHRSVFGARMTVHQVDDASAGVITGFSPSTDGSDPEPIAIAVIDQILEADTFSVPEHRHGPGQYTFSKDQFESTVVIVDPTGSADACDPAGPCDIITAPTNNLQVDLTPHPATLSGNVELLTAEDSRRAEAGDFEILATPVSVSSPSTWAEAKRVDIVQNDANNRLGTFSFDSVLEPGEWILTIEPKNQGTSFFNLGEAVQVEVLPGQDLTLASPLVVVEQATVTFTLSPDGAELTLSDASGNVITPKTNTLEFVDLDPDISYTASVTASEHVAQSVSLVLSPGEDREVTVTLSQWDRVFGSVRSFAGTENPIYQDLALATATFVDASDATYVFSTNELGQFEGRLPPGTWEVTIAANGHNEPASQPAQINTAVEDAILEHDLLTTDLRAQTAEVTIVVCSSGDLDNPTQDQCEDENLGLIDQATVTLRQPNETTVSATQTVTNGVVTIPAKFMGVQALANTTIEVVAPEHLTIAEASIEITPGGDITYFVVMTKAVVELSGEVDVQVNADGMGNWVVIGPLQGAEATVVRNNGDVAGEAITGVNGSYSILELQNGPAELAIDPEPNVESNMMYGDNASYQLQVNNQSQLLEQNHTFTAVNGGLSVTLILPDPAGKDLSNLELVLDLEKIVEPVSTVANDAFSAVFTGSTTHFEVPPSKPHNFATPTHQWTGEARDKDGGDDFQTVEFGPFDISPAATTTLQLTVLTSPAAPENVTVNSGVGTFSVSWAPVPANNDGGTDVTAYEVSYSIAGQPAVVTSVGADATTFNGPTDLDEGATVEVSVAATNNIGTGDSASGAGNVAGPSGEPTDLTISVSETTVGVLTASWSPPANDGGSDVTSYTLQYRRLGTTPWVEVLNATSTGQDTEQLDPGIEYEFQVFAVTDVGPGQPTAPPTVQKAVGEPSQPPMPSVTNVFGGQLDVTLTAPDFNGGDDIELWEIRAAGDNSTTVTCFYSAIDDTATSPCTVREPHALTLTGLTNGVTYDVSVRARNSTWYSPFSDASPNNEPLTIPDAPTITSLFGSADGFDVTLTAGAGDGGPGDDSNTDDLEPYQYRIYADDNGAIDRNQLIRDWTDSGTTGTTFTIAGLEPDTTYWVEIRARNSYQPSVSSAPVVGTTDSPPPPPPPPP